MDLTPPRVRRAARRTREGSRAFHRVRDRLLVTFLAARFLPLALLLAALIGGGLEATRGLGGVPRFVEVDDSLDHGCRRGDPILGMAFLCQGGRRRRVGQHPLRAFPQEGLRFGVSPLSGDGRPQVAERLPRARIRFG
jgi:hypothetical protein